MVQRTREPISSAFAEWKLSDDPRPIASAIGPFIDKHYKGSGDNYSPG